jgi:hypothetical protein
MPKDKPKQIFGNINPSDTDHGNITVPKSQIAASKDPMALRHAISEQYTEMVQNHPDVEFGIIVDPNSDDIKISWRKIKS